MSRKVSVLGVIVVMMVTVMATVAVAFAAPGEGGTGQENGQGNGLEKVTICHNGHTITVGAPGAAAHLAHHDGDDGDTEDACADEGTTPEPPGGTTPTLTTEADATAALGGTISDTATLSGATSAATGTITFTVYGPYDASVDPATELSDPCAVDDLVFSSDPLPIGALDSQGNYVVESPEFEPLEVGRYQWIASYSGDAENEASETSCRDANEASVVSEDSSTGATQQNMTVAGEIGEPVKPAKGTKDAEITDGTNQSDRLSGGGGPDVMRALLSGDQLYGDHGADTLFGNADGDFLQGGRGPDAMFGGPQNDLIDGVDGKGGNDEIDGGEGTDHCVGDEGDTFRNCEGNVVAVTVPTELPVPEGEAGH